jgi:hypothetical protein
MYSFINLIVVLLALCLSGISNAFLFLGFAIETLSDRLWYWVEDRNLTQNWRI